MYTSDKLSSMSSTQSQHDSDTEVESELSATQLTQVRVDELHCHVSIINGLDETDEDICVKISQSSSPPISTRALTAAVGMSSDSMCKLLHHTSISSKFN